MTDELKHQEDRLQERQGALHPKTLDLMKAKRASIKEATDDSFQRSRNAEKREAYRVGQLAIGRIVKPRQVHDPLPGEDIEDMRARLKSERNAADYAARLAREGKAKIRVDCRAMSPDQLKAHKAKLRFEARAAAKKAAPDPLEALPNFGRF